MKTCKTCGQQKPLDEYYQFKARARNPSGGYFGECKACSRSRAKEWGRARRSADPRYATDVALRTKYGIALADYEQLLEDQGGQCAICGAAEPGGRGERFHVDHDHVTDEVRGLLCHACNTGLGAFGEDIDRMTAAMAYLLSRRDVLEAVVF